MKPKINSQIKLFKQSIDWWREESLKTSLEVEELQVLFESGAISEEEVIEQEEELGSIKLKLMAKDLFGETARLWF